MPSPDAFKLPTRETPSLWRKYRLEITVWLGGALAIFGIFVSHAFRESDTVDRAAAGQLGDFVGGFVGTFFALVSVVLLIRTLREQRQSGLKEEFENKYFALVKMHRDNVAELQLQSAIGRRIFVLMLRELRAILDVAKSAAQRHKLQLTREQLLHVSYYCLFFGVGPNSSRMLSNSLIGFDVGFVQALSNELDNKALKDLVTVQLQLGYAPFDGHQSRLGHYYRHLYQAVCYVDQAPDLSDFEKYQYVKTIRAQLSTQEQALLLVNSLTPIGHGWWEDKLMIKYRLVKNLPKGFFDETTEIDVSPLFPSGYFEWEEVESRKAS